MINKRKAREIVVQALFQNEFAPPVSEKDFLQLFEDSVPPETMEFAFGLIQGIKAQQHEIDMMIQNSSAHWKMNRMSGVDRQILRLATYEMGLMQPQLKPTIAINEAVEIAKQFGTSESASFVNGLLDQLRKVKGWE